MKARQARWYAEHKDEQREYQRRYRARNRAKVRAAFKAWAAANPAKARAAARASQLNRRAQERGADGRVTAADIAYLLDKQKGRCGGCTKKTLKLQVDHILAVAKGGKNERRNLQLLCPTCNREKSARDAIEWAQSNGRLL